MAKYSYELKKEIVTAYLNGEGGYESLSKKYGISSTSDICKWVNNYNAFGDSGLMRSKHQKKYTFDEKLHMVELYLSSELSYQELALRNGITNPSLITQWVRRFRAAGPDGLRPHKKGRQKPVKHPKDHKPSEPTEAKIDTSVEYVKKLEDDLLKLKIENAFLKELRRLRLEDETKMRERRESSTVSEDNSN